MSLFFIFTISLPNDLYGPAIKLCSKFLIFTLYCCPECSVTIVSCELHDHVWKTEWKSPVPDYCLQAREECGPVTGVHRYHKIGLKT